MLKPNFEEADGLGISVLTKKLGRFWIEEKEQDQNECQNITNIDRKAKLKFVNQPGWNEHWLRSAEICRPVQKFRQTVRRRWINLSRWRTECFDGKSVASLCIGKFGSTFSIWQECQSVWIWNLCHRPFFQAWGFFYVLKFTFDRPLGSDDLIHIFNPNSENILLTSGILKMFFTLLLCFIGPWIM